MRQRPHTGRTNPVNRRRAIGAERGRNLRARRRGAAQGGGVAQGGWAGPGRWVRSQAASVARDVCYEPDHFEPDRGEPAALAGTLVGVIGDPHAIAAHAAEYERLCEFIHDETTACERCGRRWYQAPPGGFDPYIRAALGVLVCEGCAEAHRIEAGGDGVLGAVAEYGSWRARCGEVVG